MDLLRKYLVPLYQAPDGTAAASDPAADPPPAGDPPPAEGGDGDPARDPAPAPSSRVPDGVISTITNLRGKTRELEQQLQEANRRAADAQALADRLARGDGTDPNAAPRQPAPTPAPTPAESTQDVNQLIDQRANYKLFLRDVQNMRQAGFKEFGTGFQNVINILDSAGAADDGVISQVLAVDPANAHVLLKTMAEDYETAERFAKMDPTQRVAELTRMSMATAAPKTDPAAPAPAPAPKPPAVSEAGRTLANARTGVSKAPAPAPAVTPSASKTVDWRSDDASDEEFSRGWDEHQRQKFGAARRV